MTFENLVNDYRRIKFEIKRLFNRETELRTLCNLPRNGNLEGASKGKNNTSLVEKYVLRIIQLEEEQALLNQKLISKRKEIIELIDKAVINVSAQEIIELKTFNPKFKWVKIACEVFLSEGYCRQLYYEGIREINKKLGEKTNEVSSSI